MLSVRDSCAIISGMTQCRVQRCMSAANEAVEPLVEAGPLCDEHREKLIAGHDWELQGSEQSATGTSESTILIGESLQALNEYILLETDFPHFSDPFCRLSQAGSAGVDRAWDFEQVEHKGL